jgi:hypothetical protein
MMNKYDKRLILDCSFPEQGTSLKPQTSKAIVAVLTIPRYQIERRWYNRHFKKPNEKPELSSPVLAISGDSRTKLSKEKADKLVARDEILKGLLGLMANETNSTAISKHYFHDSLLEEKEREDKGSSNDPADAGFLKELEQSEPNSSQDSAVSAMATVLAKKRLELGAGSSGQNGCESDPSAENGSKKRPVSHLKPRKPKMVHDDDDTPSPLKYPRGVDHGKFRETEEEDTANVPSPSGSEGKLKRSNGQDTPSPRKKARPRAEEDQISIIFEGFKTLSQSKPKANNSFFPKLTLPHVLRGILQRKES